VPKEVFKIEVGRRLRTTTSAVGFRTTVELAAHLGAERGRVDGWLNGQSLPPVQFMARFARAFGLTLDWIYLGDPRGLTVDKAILLQAIQTAHDVPNRLLTPRDADPGWTEVRAKVAVPPEGAEGAEGRSRPRGAARARTAI